MRQLMYVVGTTFWNPVQSRQFPKCIGLLSTPSCPAWSGKIKNIFLKKKKFTVGCHRKRPKLMRSNKERTCAGKAIIGKRHIIVIFAVLNILQLVIQHCSGNCLTVTGHIDNTARIQYWCCQIFKMSFCVVLHDIVWYFMVFTCIVKLIEVIFKSFASFSSAQCKLKYTVNDPGWPD